MAILPWVASRLLAPYTYPLLLRGLHQCIGLGLDVHTCKATYYLLSRVIVLLLLVSLLYVVSETCRIYSYLRRREAFLAQYKGTCPLEYPLRSTLSRERITRSLEDLKNKVQDPTLGMMSLGDGSPYEVLRESIVMLAGGPAVLLQLAHPIVAYGVDAHSYTRKDARRRFHNTFRSVFAVTFGDLSSVVQTFKRVRSIHERVNGHFPEDVGPYKKGDEYKATDERAALWVLATLIDYNVVMYECCVRPLSWIEKENFYQQFLAEPWGIRQSLLPKTFCDFQVYVAEVLASNELAVSEPAQEMVEYLLNPLPWEKLLRLPNTYKIVTALFTPPSVRQQYGMNPTFVEYVYGCFLLAAVKSVYCLMPGSIRYFTKYQEALARKAGKELSLLNLMGQKFGDFVVRLMVPPPENEQKHA